MHVIYTSRAMLATARPSCFSITAYGWSVIKCCHITDVLVTKLVLPVPTVDRPTTSRFRHIATRPWEIGSRVFTIPRDTSACVRGSGPAAVTCISAGDRASACIVICASLASPALAADECIRQSDLVKGPHARGRWRRRTHAMHCSHYDRCKVKPAVRVRGGARSAVSIWLAVFRITLITLFDFEMRNERDETPATCRVCSICRVQWRHIVTAATVRPVHIYRDLVVNRQSFVRAKSTSYIQTHTHTQIYNISKYICCHMSRPATMTSLHLVAAPQQQQQLLSAGGRRRRMTSVM